MHLMTTPTGPEDLGQQIEVDEAVMARTSFHPRLLQIPPTCLDLRLTNAGLPQGTQILSASRHGSDRWARTAKLVARLPDGAVRAFLLRVRRPRHTGSLRHCGG